ncbi:hypothetical protein EJB05_04102, partial [Eragrostis curvula]
MKLKITVVDAGAAPAPAPWSPSPASNPADVEGDFGALAPGSPSTAPAPASGPAAGVDGHRPCFGGRGEAGKAKTETRAYGGTWR